ncbi:hypothetical protein HHK36_009664 [Tetracentron sinense]|uniref:R13L1/DRL21-like LRR repeat region domain-containing protein n=1 Tax=Tetracentron sinense TaxID=13715 RepID=A0A834ZFM5_TETSI|nr:hypothetical protein HHK36_009664 [Tetracentron sinense]
MQQLTALEHLTIMYCPNLASLPEGLQYLYALRSLSILSCPELASLPEGLIHVTTLQNLEIRSCPGLMEFPESVENLISLRSLAISDCHNLTYLPEGLQRLNALQHLSIRDCPELERRCKERGEDWQKIAHIPHIYIGTPRSKQEHDVNSQCSFCFSEPQQLDHEYFLLSILVELCSVKNLATATSYGKPGGIGRDTMTEHIIPPLRARGSTLRARAGVSIE